MHFVDGDRVVEPGRILAARHPFGIVPGVIVEIGDDRARVGSQLRAESERIGLEREEVSASADNLVLVDGALVELRDEEFPYAGGTAGAHRVYAAVPVIEISHHANAARAGRPDREIDAAHTGNGFQMGA